MSSALPELSAAGEPADASTIEVSTWRARAIWSAAALGTLLVGLGAWLLVPRERTAGGPDLPPLRICLVDVSGSATMERKWREWIEPELVRASREARLGGEELSVIAFGEEVRRIFGPGAPTAFVDSRDQVPALDVGPGETSSLLVPANSGRATRLADALDVAADLARGHARAGCRVVLLGDGTYTGKDPRPLLHELADLGVELERRDVPPRDLGEIGFAALSLPGEIELGAPIAAEFDVFYAPPDGRPSRELTLLANHEFAAGHSSRSFQVRVPPDLAADADGYLRWRVRAEAGKAEVGTNVVSISSSQQSSPRLRVLNRVEGIVRVKGQLRIGLVSDGVACVLQRSPDPSLTSTGVDLEPLWLDRLAQRLPELDAVVTCDIPPDRLPHELLADFVRRGGGWFAFYGEQSLRSFGTDDVRALELLPLQPREEDRPPRDVVFLVDRSGSMAGDRTENVMKALFAVLGLVPARDSIELVWFSDHLSEPVRMPDASDPSRRERPYSAHREFADRVLAARGPGGPTALVRSLGELAAARERSGRESIVFLLSDGHDTIDADPNAAAPALLQRLSAARARLVVIAAGEDADRALLSKLVAPGEALEDAGSIADSGAARRLESIFERALGEERVRRGDALVVLPAPALSDASSAPTLGRDIVAAMPRELPAIRAFVRAQSTPDAEVLWVSEKGEPILALKRVGLGLTAACASAPAQDWADAWRDRGDLFDPLLRLLARGKPGRSPRARVQDDTLVVEDLPDDAPAQLEARVFGADEKADDPPRARIPLSAPTEGDPRHVRQGRIAGDAVTSVWDDVEGDERREHRSARVPWIEVRASDDAQWTPLALPLVAPAAPEFILPRPRIPDEPFAADLASNQTLSLERGQSRPHPAAAGVLFSGLILLTAAGLAGFFARRAA